MDAQVLKSQAIAPLFGLDSTSGFKLEGQYSAWFARFPNAATQLAVSDPDSLAYLAHRVIREAYSITGIPRQDSIDRIIHMTTFGADRYYLDDRIERLEKAAGDFCGGKVAPEVRDAARLSSIVSDPDGALDVYEHVPLPILRLLHSQYLGGKTCARLVQDLFGIVEPHRSPLGARPGQAGQIEGTSILVAREFFLPGIPVGEAPLFRVLDELSRVERLDPGLGLWDALNASLAGNYGARTLIFALSAVSHNHALELYVHKGVLELEEDPIRATRLARSAMGALNHFYQLVNDHQRGRRLFAPRDPLARADKPYHFWGGALVACELVNRGYRPQIAEKFSAMVGSVYEFLTRRSKSESTDEVRSSEDAELHEEGARFGVRACQDGLN